MSRVVPTEANVSWMPELGRVKVWKTAWRCTRCGDAVVHVEVSPYDDEPYGLPRQMRRCTECGGKREPVKP